MRERLPRQFLENQRPRLQHPFSSSTPRCQSILLWRSARLKAASKLLSSKLNEQTSWTEKSIDSLPYLLHASATSVSSRSMAETFSARKTSDQLRGVSVSTGDMQRVIDPPDVGCRPQRAHFQGVSDERSQRIVLKRVFEEFLFHNTSCFRSDRFSSLGHSYCSCVSFM